MATSTTKNVKETVQPVSKVNWKKEWGELVKVYVPTEDGDDTPLCGCLNGTNWKIPRNEWIEVPKAIAEIIDQTRRVIRESEERNKKFEKGEINLT